MSDWIFFNYMISLRNQYNHKDIDRFKVKEWEKIFHSNTNQRKTEVVILIQNKVGFRTRNATKDKTFHIDKLVNSSRRENNTKRIYT